MAAPKKPAKSTPGRKFATLEELGEIAGKAGYEIIDRRGEIGRCLKLIHKTDPEKWAWIIDPKTDTLVTKVRSVSYDNWPRLLKANIDRIEAINSAPPAAKK